MSTLTKMTRTVKKLEVPRPLKSTSSVIHTRNSVMDLKINSVDDLIVLTETVACEISLGQYDRCFHSNVSTMYQNLKLHGAQLEAMYKDLLDRFFVLFRNGSQDENLDKRSRLHLLELIELRAKMWQETDNMSHYYKHRVTNTEPLPITNSDCLVSGDSIPLSLATPASPIETPAPLLLAPGEIMKNSGKFVKPTKIPGKNYSKDEVVIRNADSGKVMGIKGRRVHMIEELSDTIISFQRVSPGAKERLVQITGPNEENVNHAKHLIGDTIRRNASPVRLEGTTGNLRDSTSSLNSSGSEENGKPSMRSHTPLSATRPLLQSLSANDVTSGDFRYTVIIGSSNFIMLSGNNLQILNEAKVILDERFSNFNEVDLMSNQAGDFFRLEMENTPGGTPILSQSLGMNGSEDTFKANGLPSPTDDDVFVKNSSEESNREIPRRTRFPRSMSLSDKKEAAERSLGKLSYSYEMILHYASSPLSKMPPNFQVPPELSRKTSLDFDGELYLQKMNAEVHSAARGTSEEVQESTEAH